MNAMFLYVIIVPEHTGTTIGSNDFDQALDLLAYWEKVDPYTVLVCTGNNNQE